MLSALRLSLARPGLGRPSRRRLVVGVSSDVPRSGDGAGLRRPKPRLPPLPADEAAKALEPGSPRQRQAAAGQPGSANALSGPQLTRRLLAAEPSQQVVLLVQQAGEQCNAFHFSAAVNRVAKLQQRRRSSSNQAAFAALLAFAEQHPAAVNHVAVAQTAYAGGVLYHRLAAQQQAAWQERLVWAFAHPKLRSNELSNSLWGWSRMGLPLQGQLAAAADAAVQRMAGQMTAQAVANTLWAFANAGWWLGSQAAAALLERLVEVLAQANAQNVANSLWAAAELGLRLSDSLTAALLERLEEVLPQANAQAVANSLWAAAKLGLRLSDSLKAAFVQALLRIIPAAKPQELANIVLACGTLRWNPGGRVLAAAVAAMQRLLASGVVEGQHVRNFLWGLAKLQGQGAKLPSALATLLDAAVDWAGSCWAQLSALDVTDLCYNLARLGHWPGSAWVDAASQRCLACVEDGSVRGAALGNFIWACRAWGHQLSVDDMEDLIPAAVNGNCADWERGRGGALLLIEALAWQGFEAALASPAVAAALQQRLLPCFYSDVQAIAAGRWPYQEAPLPYLAGWASSLAAINLTLPAHQLEAIVMCVGKHSRRLKRGNAEQLQRAFNSWGYQPGQRLMERLLSEG